MPPVSAASGRDNLRGQPAGTGPRVKQMFQGHAAAGEERRI
jgi:hypothetical protein